MADKQKRAITRSVLRDSMTGIRRNSVMSLASVFSIMAALVILGIFLLLTINIQKLTENVENNLEVKVFLTQNCSEADKTRIKAALENNELVNEVRLETKEEALNNFSEQLSSYSGLLDSYNDSNNPMPESFVVTGKDADRLGEIKTFASSLGEGVEYVKYGEDYITALTNFDRFANVMSIVVTIILSIISLMLIYNTIRITVFARRKEIGIMKYVGATDAYIRTPFVLEGIFLGIIAALVSLMAIRGVYYYILGFMSGNSLLSVSSNFASPSEVVGSLSLFFIIYGVVIGAIGSMVAIRKFLDV